MSAAWTPEEGWHEVTEEERAALQAEAVARITGGDYHCPCGWSRIVLEGETVADARRKHEGTEIHRLATQNVETA